MKKKNIIGLVNSVVLLGVIVFLLLNNKTSNKVVYVDNIKLFNSFNLTKELGALSEQKYKPELEVYDNLVNKISLLEDTYKEGKKKMSKKDTEEYVNLKRQLSVKENELANLKNYVKTDINKKVWKRLNEYVKSYGEEKGIQLILGAQGGGNIMYGMPAADITDDFIEYANAKYEGK